MQEKFDYTANELNQLRIIIIALTTGLTLFCIMFVWFASGQVSGMSNSQNSSSIAPTLRIVHLVLTLILLWMSKFIGDGILSGRIRTRTAIVGQVASPFMRYRTSVIVRLALLEAATLFGGIVFNLSATSMSSDPTLYLHLLPLLFFFMAAKSWYPTDFKMEEIKRRFEE